MYPSRPALCNIVIITDADVRVFGNDLIVHLLIHGHIYPVITVAMDKKVSCCSSIPVIPGNRNPHVLPVSEDFHIILSFGICLQRFQKNIKTPVCRTVFDKNILYLPQGLPHQALDTTGYVPGSIVHRNYHTDLIMHGFHFF